MGCGCVVALMEKGIDAAGWMIEYKAAKLMMLG